MKRIILFVLLGFGLSQTGLAQSQTFTPCSNAKQTVSNLLQTAENADGITPGIKTVLNEDWNTSSCSTTVNQLTKTIPGGFWIDTTAWIHIPNDITIKCQGKNMSGTVDSCEVA